MIASASQILVLLFGIAILALSVFGIYAPASLLRLVKGVAEQAAGIYVAVAVRLVLGAALIVSAPTSQFPAAFRALGWIAIAAALVLIFTGRERVRRLVGWFAQLSGALVRVWLVFGIAFGAFLIHGVS
jgi:hypothetical protein